MKTSKIQIEIEGTTFTVDSSRQLLTEAGNAANTISFEMLKDEGDFFSTLYNTATRNIYHGWIEFGKEPEGVKRIIIPAAVLLRNNDLQKSDVQEINAISKRRNWGIVLSSIKEDKKGKKARSGNRIK